MRKLLVPAAVALTVAGCGGSDHPRSQTSTAARQRATHPVPSSDGSMAAAFRELRRATRHGPITITTPTQ